MNVKRIISFLLIIVLASVFAIGCSSSDNSTKTKGENQTTNTENSDNAEDKITPVVKQNDDDGTSPSSDNDSSDENSFSDNIDGSDTVNFSGELSITAEDGGEVKEEGNRYIFTNSGEYHVRGTCINRMIYIDAKDCDLDIHLEGVNMTSDIGALIYVENAEEVTVSATDGTNNELNDNRPARKSKNEESEYGNAAIYSKDDLKFKGRGRLTINGSYNNGIGCKNDIKIKNLTLTINAANNGIKGDDSVTVESGNITIVANNGSGIKTENTHVSNKGNQKGYITITGGKIDINSADDPIDAAFDLILDSKNASVTTNK